MNLDLALGESVSMNADGVQAQILSLMDRYEQRLYVFLLVRTHNREVARDCLQHALLQALEQLRRGRPVTSAWLYKVARNRATDEIRRVRRTGLDPATLDLVPWTQPVSNPRTASVRRAVECLTPDERELLYLFDVDGFSAREIGAVIGIRAGAVRMRVLRARDRFRAAYVAEEDER